MKATNMPAVDVTIGGQTRIYHAFAPMTTVAAQRAESGRISAENSTLTQRHVARAAHRARGRKGWL